MGVGYENLSWLERRTNGDKELHVGPMLYVGGSHAMDEHI